jgi:hypothetical protein
MRLFQIDINRLVVLLLPTFLRTRINFAFARAMIQPVDTMMDWFNATREANLYNLKHNGQTCYLRAVLNDIFDTELRRIRIGDSERFDWTYIYPEATDRPLWLSPIDTGITVLLASEAFTSDEGTDFSVIIPPGIPKAIRPQLISVINYYKLAGKRYSILFE